MSEQITTGEISRWMQAFERRVGEMHGENRAGLAEIKASVANLADLQRVQNGRVANIQERTSLLERRAGSLEQQQRSTDEQIDRIQAAATQAATGAATQAIHETAPTQKRMTALGAIAAGVTTGGMLGLYWIGKMVFDTITK